MKRIKTFHWLAVVLVVACFNGLFLSSCATTGTARSAKQRQGFMLMQKSEYSRNKGHFKETKRPKAIRNRKRNANSRRR